MFTGNVLGYLGADAKEIKKEENKVSICFNVSSNLKTASGEEKTTWISCFLNRPSKVVEYLKKGTMVYVSGDISVNVYEREDGKTVPNITMNVWKIELCGSSPEK